MKLQKGKNSKKKRWNKTAMRMYLCIWREGKRWIYVYTYVYILGKTKREDAWPMRSQIVICNGSLPIAFLSP